LGRGRKGLERNKVGIGRQDQPYKKSGVEKERETRQTWHDGCNLEVV